MAVVLSIKVKEKFSWKLDKESCKLKNYLKTEE